MADEFLNRAGTQVLARKIKENAQYAEGIVDILNRDHKVNMTMYASEADLPAAIDFESGVVTSVGAVAWCVAEKSWHKVTAIDTETLAVTWSDYDPHIQADIDLSAYKKQFNGTLAEWNALSEDEQAGYDSAAIDDVAGAGSMLTGTVEEGNENAVTSDAVAKAIASLIVVQSGVTQNPAITNNSSDYYKTVAVTFPTAMPSANYDVTFSVTGSYWADVCVSIGAKTATGFTIQFALTHPSGSGYVITSGNFQVRWRATYFKED